MTVQLPNKPKFGTACNGCGVCCSLSLCQIGELAYPGAQAPCPALKIAPDGTRTICGIVESEIVNRMTPIIQSALGIGVGCSMSDEDTTDEMERMQDALRDEKYKALLQSSKP